MGIAAEPVNEIMSTMIESRATTDIEQKLVGAWSRERRYFHLRGVARLSFWVVGLFLFDLLVDWLFDLPGGLRVVLLLLNLGVLGWLAYQHWIRYLQRFDPTRVALQVERLHPQLNSLLVSYVQLKGEVRETHGSPQLIEVMRGQAVRAVTPLSFAGIVDFRTLRKLLSGAAVVLVLFLGSSVLAGSFYGTLLARLFNPFSEAEYPTRTRVEDRTETVVVKEGDRIDLRAEVSGEIPETGTLHVQHGTGPWEKVALSRTGEASFAHQVLRAAKGFTYYFEIGDGRSKRRKITVVTPPRIVEAKVEVTFPSYTGQGSQEEKSLQLPPMLEGTKVAWELRCDQPLKAGEFLLQTEAGPKARPLAIDDKDPHVARLTVNDVAELLPPGKEGQRKNEAVYRFGWTVRVTAEVGKERRDFEFTFVDPARYTLEVKPDQAPIVTLLIPPVKSEQDRLLITKRKLLNIVFEATDDHGLARAWLAYRRNNDPERKRYPLGAFENNTKSDTFKADWPIRDTLTDIREGDQLVCEVEAEDNRVSGGGANPNVGRSRVIRLQVVSEAEYQSYIEKEKALGLDRTRTALREEIESKTKIKALIPE